MRRAALLAVFTTLAACSIAAPRIVEVTPGTYRASKTDGVLVRKVDALKIDLIHDAQAFCAAKGKRVELRDATTRDAEGTDRATASIDFNCI